MQNRPLSDALTYFALALLTVAAILFLFALIDFPGSIARLLIATIGVVISASLGMDGKWGAMAGFLLGYLPFCLMVFTSLGEPIALWFIELVA